MATTLSVTIIIVIKVTKNVCVACLYPFFSEATPLPVAIRQRADRKVVYPQNIK